MGDLRNVFLPEVAIEVVAIAEVVISFFFFFVVVFFSVICRVFPPRDGGTATRRLSPTCGHGDSAIVFHVICVNDRGDKVLVSIDGGRVIVTSNTTHV